MSLEAGHRIDSAEIHRFDRDLRADPTPRPAPAERVARKKPGYSAFVSLMRVVLPALALVIVVLIIAWPQLKGQESLFQLGFSDLSVDQANKLNMLNARYYGTDSNNQPFSVTADQATETAPGSRLVELAQPKADLSRADGTWLMMGADTGYYQQQDQTLDLVGSVNVFHDQGYELHTSAAHLNLKQAMAGGDEPVKGQGPFGNIAAEGFRLLDKGRRIVFTGKTRLTVFPGTGGNLR